MAILSALGVPNRIIGYLFVGFTIVIYAVIGILSRTMQVGEYYVAGRAFRQSTTAWRPAPTGCPAHRSSAWPARSISLGYDGLAFVLGWTGGYVLVAILVAPYLRKFGAYTVPDFLSARYGGNLARFIGVVVLFSCSFTYVVAQIYAHRASSRPASSALTSTSRSMSALPASWSARCSAACARSPGRRSPSTSC